ncbi:MAG: ion transporter [Pseudomonadota bacterium]
MPDPSSEQKSSVSGQLPTLKARARAVLTDPRFEKAVIALIIVNAITIGLETSDVVMARFGPLLLVIDQIILAIFTVEVAARIWVFGRSFWKDPWNVFDAFVVGIALLPTTQQYSVLRALRILRALRLISSVPSLRRVVGSLLSAIPSMGSIVLLLTLVNYVAAVMATKLYGDTHEELFGTIGASLFTLFQVMTLEGWAMEVVRPVMEKHPTAWLFFLPYIIIVVFAVLNLFIGIIVDAMQHQSDDVAEAVIEVTEREYHQLMREISALREDIRGMKTGNGSVQPGRGASDDG